MNLNSASVQRNQSCARQLGRCGLSALSLPHVFGTPSSHQRALAQPVRLMQRCNSVVNSPVQAFPRRPALQPLPRCAAGKRSLCNSKAGHCSVELARRAMSAAAGAATPGADPAVEAAAEVPPVDDQLVARALKRHPRIILGTGSSSRRGELGNECRHSNATQLLPLAPPVLPAALNN